MKSKHASALGIACLALLSMGNTDCNDYEQVEARTNDRTPPVTALAVHKYGIVQGAIGRQGFVYRLSSKSDAVLALSSTTDSGGTREVRMDWRVEVKCCPTSTNNGCYNRFAGNAANGSDDIVETQPGTAGSMVSDGVYAVDHVSASGYQYLCGGDNLRFFHYDWSAIGTDFSGNRDTASGAVLEWGTP